MTRSLTTTDNKGVAEPDADVTEDVTTRICARCKKAPAIVGVGDHPAEWVCLTCFELSLRATMGIVARAAERLRERRHNDR